MMNYNFERKVSYDFTWSLASCAGKVGCACTHVFQTLEWVIGVGGYGILYADDLNLIFMNITVKLSKNRMELRLFTCKVTHFSAPYCPRILTVLPNISSDIVIYLSVCYANIHTSILIHDHENIRNKRKVAENFRDDILTK